MLCVTQGRWKYQCFIYNTMYHSFVVWSKLEDLLQYYNVVYIMQGIIVLQSWVELYCRVVYISQGSTVWQFVLNYTWYCNITIFITIYGTIWGHLEVNYKINARVDQTRVKIKILWPEPQARGIIIEFWPKFDKK